MMRPEFAVAVDRIFHEAIKLLTKIEEGIACDAEHEQAAILALFDRADIELGDARQWRLAKYAIAVWIDEMLLTVAWEGAAWWRNHILEMELFQSRICHVRFFELAKEASGLPARDALEVFYNCVALGFRGMYADREFGQSNPSHKAWPSSVERWMERTARMIEVDSRQSRSEGPLRSVDGAAPLHGRTQVIWWSVAALLLLLANGTIFHFLCSTR